MSILRNQKLTPKSTPPKRLVPTILLVLLTGFILFKVVTSHVQKPAPAKISPPMQSSITPPAASIPWTEVTIKKGQSLALIFQQLGLSDQLLYKVSHEITHPKEIASIRPGQVLKFQIQAQQLHELIYEKDRFQYLHITKKNNRFQSTLHKHTYDPVPKTAFVSIEDSLFLSGQREGLSDSVIMQLANIFAWDIDFALDIRQGDQFAILYVEKVKQGVKIGDGPILAARFINRNKQHYAFRFNPKGQDAQYYDQDGKSLQKAFLRSPVDFARISSRFNLRRKHPILNRIRAHKGVDYAARTGTPIKATGNGKVSFKGRKGGYGNTIILQHGQRYTTLYAHMSGFAKGIATHSKVKQGQVIGYVGKTGLASGPHLHYEFRVNGAHKNPLSVKLPQAKSLPKSNLPAFEKKKNIMLRKLPPILTPER